MSMHVVPPVVLSQAKFAPFGEALLKPRSPGTSAGDGWECWFDIGTLHGADMRLGQVVTEPTSAPIEVMERHPDDELLVPVTGTLLQAVAPSANVNDPADRPESTATQVFRIAPGEAIIIRAGTWHAAARPLTERCLYYFAGLPHAPEPGRDHDPWVRFANEMTVVIDPSMTPVRQI